MITPGSVGKLPNLYARIDSIARRNAL
jgi:hypothetical protein